MAAVAEQTPSASCQTGCSVEVAAAAAVGLADSDRMGQSSAGAGQSRQYCSVLAARE